MAEAMRRETWPFMVGFVGVGALYVHHFPPFFGRSVLTNVLISFYKLHTSVSGESHSSDLFVLWHLHGYALHSRLSLICVALL
jgi:hypothetical protein